jgi:N-acetylneuraminate synthase/N,N'-diacetyllegionaminate synthase
MSILFLIPARGGSKGLPGKNLMSVGGIPLVGRAIRTARQAAKLLGDSCRVVCSTDSAQIAQSARDWGAEVPFDRPRHLATDNAKSIGAVLHALETLKPAKFEILVLLQPTSPLTTAQDVLGAVVLHQKSGASVVSVSQLEHPAAWQFQKDNNGCLAPLLDSKLPALRQEAQSVFRLNGAIYVATPEFLEKFGGFIGPNTHGYEMPASRSIDIDTEFDLRIARFSAAEENKADFKIGSQIIGEQHPCFVIAEAGVNHNGNLDLAHRLVDTAADAGASAIKFQTWITEKLCRPGAKKADYQRAQCPADDDQFTMLKGLELPYAWHAELKSHAERRGITFLSTPHDADSASFLCELGIAAMKVGSGELTNLPFLRRVGELGKPVILSTGMGSLDEVGRAVAAVREIEDIPIALLHCLSAYPAPEDQMNLRCIRTLREEFGFPVGLSDHSLASRAAMLGAALGMCIFEKHLTLDRSLPGPDHAASSDPKEFAELVQLLHQSELMLGSGKKHLAPAEINTRQVVTRTLLYAGSFEAGYRVRTKDLEALRCGLSGMPPEASERLVGRALRRPVKHGSVVDEGDFD